VGDKYVVTAFLVLTLTELRDGKCSLLELGRSAKTSYMGDP
jgi:hypothetical protein